MNQKVMIVYMNLSHLKMKYLKLKQKRILITEKDVQIIKKEEYTNEESTEQKVIFDISIFEQIKGKELDLSVKKIFKLPLIRNI